MNTSETTRTVMRDRGIMGVPATGRSLADRFPDVAAEWDSVANSGITPLDGGRFFAQAPPLDLSP